jgi:hypothetical protein
MRVKIDSAPQQAAIYVDSKEYGIEGYTPQTLRLPKGTYTIILELPGFQQVQRPIEVKRSQAFVFTLERAARPAVLDVRVSQANDSALGGQLFVDGAPVGTVPARVEVPAGNHLVEVKKPGFKDWRDQAQVQEGDQRTIAVDMTAEVKKGVMLVTADVAGADVYVDGQRRDATPALIGDLPEGPHTVEVRKDPLPPWKQVVNVIGGQQVKVEAAIQAAVPQTGSIRVVSSTPGAEVFVDGEPKGAVNAELTGIRPGQHIVEVRAKGYTPQTVELTVAANEQRIAKLDLAQVQVQAQTARLRVVTAVPEAEVFLDGSSVGKAPIDRNDLAPGKHYVVVRARGYAEWKREVMVDPAAATTLTADLSASGQIKVIANVPGADVLIDGAIVGKSPVTADNVAAGEHVIEVKAKGYVDARQGVHLDGGEQKVLSAELASLSSGPSPAEVSRRNRSMSSFSAVTIDPNHFTADIAGGFIPFGEFRLTVGAWRGQHNLGFDTGIEIRSSIYMTEGLVHGKFQFVKAGPVALGANIALGGGGGPGGRNDFVFELGVPLTLLFGDLVRFTVHPYLQVYTDRNCPQPLPDAKSFGDNHVGQSCGLATVVSNSDLMLRGGGPASPLDRFAGARLMLQAALEISVHQVANIFFIFEADPIGPRASLSGYYSDILPNKDFQVYGRAGVTFKF